MGFRLIYVLYITLILGWLPILEHGNEEKTNNGIRWVDGC